MVSLPSVKMSGMQSEVSRALQCCTLGLKTLSHLLGELVATQPVVFVAPLHCCTLQQMKISLIKFKHKTIQSDLTRGTKKSDMVVHRVATEQLLSHGAT